MLTIELADTTIHYGFHFHTWLQTGRDNLPTSKITVRSSELSESSRKIKNLAFKLVIWASHSAKDLQATSHLLNSLTVIFVKLTSVYLHSIQTFNVMVSFKM